MITFIWRLGWRLETEREWKSCVTQGCDLAGEQNTNILKKIYYPRTKKIVSFKFIKGYKK